MNWKPWSDADRVKLAEMFAAKCTDRQMADAIGRSMEGIACQRQHLGMLRKGIVKRKPASPNPLPCWSAHDVAELRRMWTENYPRWAIADELAKTEETIQHAVIPLGLPVRDPVAVIRVGKSWNARKQDQQRRSRDQDNFPSHIAAIDAAKLAGTLGLQWRSRRSDLAELNRALNTAGRRPVYVPFCELRP